MVDLGSLGHVGFHSEKEVCKIISLFAHWFQLLPRKMAGNQNAAHCDSVLLVFILVLEPYRHVREEKVPSPDTLPLNFLLASLY